MAYNYPDLEFDDLSRAFSTASFNVSELSNKIATETDKPIGELRTSDFIDYTRETEPVEFVPYAFKGKMAEIFGGSIMIAGNGLVEIGYNSSVNEGRQHFTILHEVNHLYNDVPRGMAGESFSDVINQGAYSEQEQYREAIANFGAAIMQIPDEPLFRMICEGASIEGDFSNEFQSSYAANFTRVRDYLIFNYQVTPTVAYELTKDYRYHPHENVIRKWFSQHIHDRMALFDLLSRVVLNMDRFSPYTPKYIIL